MAALESTSTAGGPTPVGAPGPSMAGPFRERKERRSSSPFRIPLVNPAKTPSHASRAKIGQPRDDGSRATATLPRTAPRRPMRAPSTAPSTSDAAGVRSTRSSKRPRARRRARPTSPPWR
jgi:hypothetical protein